MDTPSRHIKIFDTTLRDGEQSPGCSMNLSEKLKLAGQLERLGVNIIEAGFAIASPGDFEAIQAISKKIKSCTVASLARALPADIDRAYEAVREAVSPRIHTFIATSPIHMAYKLKRSPEQVIETAREMVTYAKKRLTDIEFSAEDATRSNPEFLARVIDAAIEAGATTINIPDTVGYTTPLEYADFIENLLNLSRHLSKVDLSVHCHNDLGMAVANSLAAIKVGATQVECTINGIGERAGNAALEEVVMALHTRSDHFNRITSIQTTEIAKTSRILSAITGVNVSPTKPIIGANAFAHESGIHQHGVLSNPTTYEIMTPESVGLIKNHMVLGKHSGKHGFADHVKTLGFQLDDTTLNKTFEAFKRLCDKKRNVYDDDIIALILRDQPAENTTGFSLASFVISSSSNAQASATVNLIDENGIPHVGISIGDGPVDAAYKAIQGILNGHDMYKDIRCTLDYYSIRSVTEGDDALGEATIRLICDDHTTTGVGMSTDILEASILAYLHGTNKHIAWKNHQNGGMTLCTMRTQ